LVFLEINLSSIIDWNNKSNDCSSYCSNSANYSFYSSSEP
jgi:hypothetical protein